MLKLEDGFYPATVLDRDNQPLSTGEARFYIKDKRGVFWPRVPVIEDLFLKNAASVQTLQGHTLTIRNVQRCPAEFVTGIHYDFDCDPEA